MLSTLTVTKQPAAEPVTVQQARNHCRIDDASDDELLEGYIKAARIMAEGYLSRVLITQTLLWTVRPQSNLHAERSHLWGPLTLPRAPVQSIASVIVLDERGNATAVSAATLPIVPPAQFTGYIIDLALEPGRLRLGHMTALIDGRTLNHAGLEYLQVSMIAGYGTHTTDVPETIRQAILLTTAFLYEHRGDAGGEMPKAAEWLLDRDRLQFLGG